MSARPSRYPLRVAQTLRQGETEEQKTKLAREQAELARAEHALAEARAALVAQRAALQTAEAANTRVDGQARAIDLQRGAAYAERQRERASALRAAVVLAEARLEAQREEVGQRRQALASAHAKEQVIERDAERFVQGERRRAEVSEEREREGRKR